MKNVIQITDKILGVIVDENAYDFMFSSAQDDADLICKKGKSISYIGTFHKCEYKIHGTCTLPAFDFEFEVTDKMASCSSSCSQSDYHKGGKCDRNGCYGKGKKGMFANKIQKAIQDEGMFVVNPVKLMDGKNISCEEEAEAYHKNMTAFIEAESKTVKKLLLIEKI